MHLVCSVTDNDILRAHTHAHTYLAKGPCFMIYNGMLRGFGDCGEVPCDVEFKSDAFWEHLKKVSVKSRMEKAGHKYSSTMHALASGIKKLQAIAQDGQGTRLYRGLGKFFLISLLFYVMGLVSDLI